MALEFFVDASNSGWGAVLDPHSDKPTTLRDYWTPEDLNKPIIIKEALALQHTLSSGNPALRNNRVDAYTDNLPLVQAWNREGSKSSDLTNVIKTIFELTLRFNIGLKLHHIPSKANLADTPSRALSKADCMLAKQSWSTLQHRWGHHTIDLMSLDSNVQTDHDGKPLPHFSPWPTPNSAGVNVFAQTLQPSENAYAFPPLQMIGPLLRFLLLFPSRYTLVVPDVFPRQFWWSIIQGKAIDRVCLGSKNQSGILLFPTRTGEFDSQPLSWDLWAFRL